MAYANKELLTAIAQKAGIALTGKESRTEIIKALQEKKLPVKDDGNVDDKYLVDNKFIGPNRGRYSIRDPNTGKKKRI